MSDGSNTSCQDELSLPFIFIDYLESFGLCDISLRSVSASGYTVDNLVSRYYKPSRYTPKMLSTLIG